MSKQFDNLLPGFDDGPFDEPLGLFDDSPAAVRDLGNDTDDFELSTGQFRDPTTGEFDAGGPPPDYDATANRFRSVDTGAFKTRPVDHFDELEEVRLNKLFPEG